MNTNLFSKSINHARLPIHNRMPVILRPEGFGAWLEPDLQDAERLQSIIETQVHTELASYPVSRAVNSVRNNRPENIEPVELSDDPMVTTAFF